MDDNKLSSSNKIIETSDGCAIVLELSENDPFFYKKKLSSSNKIIETSDGCAIVLELSENDPFFYKKKNLLHGMGFDVREQVQLQNSSLPDSITATLERVLQLARITHLDEVELYFGEVDDSYWSTRNEVEALNSVLSVVNSYSSTERQKELNVLQAFQDAIFDRIKEFTYKNKVETRIDKSYSCDEEKRLAKWGDSNGVKSNLEIACVGGAGRGAIATKDLKVGDVALEIPVSIIISEKLVHNSAMFACSFIYWRKLMGFPRRLYCCYGA